MNNHEILNFILQIQKKAFGKEKICSYPSCEEQAINSHLLQKNGILNQIAGNSNSLYSIKPNIYNKNFYEYKLIGIGKLFTFKGFCKKHDYEIFKPIENDLIDYDNYISNLLFSYRALINEKWKKEAVKIMYTNILESKILQNELPNHILKHYENLRSEIIIGINNQSYYENLFLKDLLTGTNSFSFVKLQTSRVEVISSAAFTYETSEEILKLNINNNIKEQLTQVYFNFFPYKNNNIVILGFPTEKKDKCWNYISNFNDEKDGDRLKKISDLLLNQIENWAMSIDFYNRNIKYRKDLLLKVLNQSNYNIDERMSVPFNLFAQAIPDLSVKNKT